MLKSALILALTVLSFNAFSAERVIILAPAAGDIFIRLGLENKVVGVTKNLDDFKNAAKVGTHIKPNLEIIKSLKPDLIIAGNGKYFTDEIKSAAGCKTYTYDPQNFSGIIKAIEDIGKMFGKDSVAAGLKKSLTGQISRLKKPSCTPKVFYEVSQTPLMTAGKGGVIDDIISHAGGQLALQNSKKIYKTNIETVLVSMPDIYIYQTGPMNRNPVPPEKRDEYKNLSTRYIKVDETEFARANTTSFSAAEKLNNIFIEFCDR